MKSPWKAFLTLSLSATALANTAIAADLPIKCTGGESKVAVAFYALGASPPDETTRHSMFLLWGSSVPGSRSKRLRGDGKIEADNFSVRLSYSYTASRPVRFESAYVGYLEGRLEADGWKVTYRPENGGTEVSLSCN